MIEKNMELEGYIENELKKFTVTDNAISELREKYLPLKIKDLDDKQGYLFVRAARMDIKAKRIEVDKKRKELTEDALKFQRSINSEAKRIIEQLEPIEAYLKEQEDSFEIEKERIKNEKIRKESELLKNRVLQLTMLEAKFNGITYNIDYVFGGFTFECDSTWLKSISDEDFDSELQKIMIAFEQEKNRRMLECKAEQERLHQEESVRKAQAEQIRLDREQLEKERAEIQAEKDRLNAIGKQMAAEDSALQKEREEIKEKESLVIEKEPSIFIAVDEGKNDKTFIQINIGFDELDTLVRGGLISLDIDDERTTIKIKLSSALSFDDIQTLIDTAKIDFEHNEANNND